MQELDSQNMAYKQNDHEEERRKVRQGNTLAWQAPCWYSLTVILKVGVESVFGGTSTKRDPRFLLAEARQVQKQDELPAAGKCSFASDACCRENLSVLHTIPLPNSTCWLYSACPGRGPLK